MRKIIKLYDSQLSHFHMNYQSRRTVLSPAYPLESPMNFNKIIKVWAPLLESGFMGKDQRPDDSGMFQGKNVLR